MEAAAVAAVAQERGIEFAAVKAISDELDFVMPPVGRFVDADGKFETARFAVLCCDAAEVVVGSSSTKRQQPHWRQ